MDTISRKQRSALMAKVRSHGTRPESIVAAILRRQRYRFAQHDAALPGKPDFILQHRRLIVFVHGCFWHKHSCRRGQSTPASNAEFWQLKRSKNVSRDRRTARKLRIAGWSVVTVWECQTKNVPALENRLLKLLKARKDLGKNAMSKATRGRDVN